MVAALHAALGAALLFGLAGGSVRKVGDALKSFDVLPPLPPVREPPPPASASAARDEAGAPDLKARPAPVIAPPPAVELPLPSPVPTADERAPMEGSDPSAGAAAVAGPGSGAGGSGTGFGGGGQGGEGNGSGSGGGLGAEARLLSGNLVRSDYRQLRGYGIPSGRAVLALTVGASGRLTACTPVQGSGSPPLDGALCAILMGRSRWSPALDGSGRPVSVQLRYTAVWNRI